MTMKGFEICHKNRGRGFCQMMMDDDGEIKGFCQKMTDGGRRQGGAGFFSLFSKPMLASFLCSP